MRGMLTAKPQPCVLVIFGASGDLTARKLIPGLYELDQRGWLPDGLRVLGVSRSDLGTDGFRAKMGESARQHATGFDQQSWDRFAPRLHYHSGDALKPEAYTELAADISRLGVEAGIATPDRAPNTLFYLSVAPTLYEPIIDQIGAAGLVGEGKRWCSIGGAQMPWQRVIIEKPFGQDLRSAVALNMALGRVFEEESTYRIDHYLGKELVQNILVMRFANAIFEPVWNRRYVDHVQVTAAESIGVGDRAGGFYERVGAIRDMIQSHLMQVLALVAIEPPANYSADAIMREKIKLLSTAKTLEGPVADNAVLGRYGPGDGTPAYTGLDGVDADRSTETFAAMRIEFDNWRWADVPFYIRSGKRMARKLTEVVIQFKRPPLNMFKGLDADEPKCPENRLIIRIAPSEGLELEVEGKVPGAGFKIATAGLELDYVEEFGGEPIEAYGPLLLDAMRGDRTLYKHREEVESGWAICEPFITDPTLRERIETYDAGSWGPPGADELLARDGRLWHNPAG